jgi:hypothetical protein
MPNVEEAAAIYHNAGLETVWNSALEERFSPSRKEKETTSNTRSIDMENNFEGFRINQKARFTRVMFYKKKNIKNYIVRSVFDEKKLRIRLFSSSDQRI